MTGKKNNKKHIGLYPTRNIPKSLYIVYFIQGHSDNKNELSLFIENNLAKQKQP